MKKILLTNDDGFEGDGLLALAAALEDLGDVTVVAPAAEKSACSHSITLNSPLSFVKIKENFYKLQNGTPADCVYLALHTMFKSAKPDLIVSGINCGANLGEDTSYSGTLGGAMEGAIYGVPSVAISQVITPKEGGGYTYSYDVAKQVARAIAAKILERGFPLSGRKILNVNVPNVSLADFKGIKTAKLAYRIYGNAAHKNTNPRGQEYYWLGLHPLDFKSEPGTDWEAIRAGYASITPIKIDLTSTQDLSALQEWL